MRAGPGGDDQAVDAPPDQLGHRPDELRPQLGGHGLSVLGRHVGQDELQVPAALPEVLPQGSDGPGVHDADATDPDQPEREVSHDVSWRSVATRAGRGAAQSFCGKPRLRPPWLGSSQREVMTLPRVKKWTPSMPWAWLSPKSEFFHPPKE